MDDFFTNSYIFFKIFILNFPPIESNHVIKKVMPLILLKRNFTEGLSHNKRIKGWWNCKTFVPFLAWQCLNVAIEWEFFISFFSGSMCITTNCKESVKWKIFECLAEKGLSKSMKRPRCNEASMYTWKCLKYFHNCRHLLSKSDMMMS